MQRVASKAPASFAPQVKDTQKRLNLLFDHLNNEELVKPDTIQKLGELAEALRGFAAIGEDTYWQSSIMQGLLVEEVEEIWAAIAENDDWGPLNAKVAALRELGAALGEPPIAQGHYTIHNR